MFSISIKKIQPPIQMKENVNVENPFYHKYVKPFLRDIVLPIVLLVIIQNFGRITYVPSGSMTPSLMEGDKVVISKLHYGIKTPQTPFQLPFFEKKYYKGIQLPWVRLPGISELKRGVCVVFNCPYESDDPIDMRTLWVKRLIAMPHDVVSVKAGEPFVNGALFVYPEKVETQRIYLIKLTQFRHSSKAIKFLQSLGISDPIPTDRANTFGIHITKKLAEKLRKNKDVVSVQPFIVPPSKNKKSYFEYGGHFAESQGGSIDFLPKVKVPGKGMKIKINKATLHIYGHVIMNHENVNAVIDAEKGTLTIDGSPVTTYTFKQNYYFMMGDNTGNSQDSRVIGFIPESHIVAKPILVLASNKGSSFFVDLFTLHLRWDRFFKLVR